MFSNYIKFFSSDSSPGGSPQHHYDGPNVELEQTLPGVIMSMQLNYSQFLLLLADKGCTLGNSQLRDAARALLKLMPADVETIAKMKNICQELIKNPIAQPMHGFDSMFFSPSPSETCYNLEICYSLLMPGTGKIQI